ncbi:MAG: ribosome small subunit-dependent GTPase A [Planctomycetota bacterium]
MSLESFGWSQLWQNKFSEYEADGLVPARISHEHRDLYGIFCERGERQAEISGRFRFSARRRSDFPAVGDWVVIESIDDISRCCIHAVLMRQTEIMRKGAGTGADEQVVAANADTACLVSGLDEDFNLRRIERYLTLAYQSGATPVIVLNKSDICPDLAPVIETVTSIAPGCEIFPVSARSGVGMDALRSRLAPGTTGVLLGSSGVGKSSIINALLGSDALKTAPVREDDGKGRHTTVHRQLLQLPRGGLLIDTPGLREIQLIADPQALSQSFATLSEIATDCRFRDCTHVNEPGCAVIEAVNDGRLDPANYESYLKQRKEIRHHQIEQDVHLKNAEKKRWISIMKSVKNNKGKRG